MLSKKSPVTEYAQTYRDNTIDADVHRDLPDEHLRAISLPLGGRLQARTKWQGKHDMLMKLKDRKSTVFVAICHWLKTNPNRSGSRPQCGSHPNEASES